jgi:hypothetical protein
MQEEETEETDTISVEFTLVSGETVSVRDHLGAPPTEEALRQYAGELARQMGTDTVRTFAYWWGGDFYVDAVRLGQVAALSVSPVAPEDDEAEEWEE